MGSANDVTKYRTKTFKGRTMGAYAQLFQRPGEGPLLALNFFEGGRSLAEAKILLEILGDAVVEMEGWAKRNLEEDERGDGRT